jgi:micrococcal nuclease
MKKYNLLILAGFLALLPITANAAEIQLREFRDRVCYDGDTCYIDVPFLPDSLRKMSIRILGIDTPEIKGKCDKEKELALEAREFANKAFREANEIDYQDLAWDKYGGRLLTNVYLDGKLYSKMIIDAGLARPYDGGTKEGWCD